MAVPEREGSVERTQEWENFIQTLREFHAKRGTSFDPEPKIGQKRVDLLRLYHRVLADGGYDRVSNTREMPLAWKAVGGDLGLDKATHAGALAFSLKTAYYRNLAAYEITTVHNKVPPPKEILEDVSAKGGNLLTRTVENYPISRRVGEEEDVEGTPNRDKMDLDDPSSGRAMRAGLRQAPPQRQLFQADPASTYRQGRQQGQRSSSPNPTYGGGLGNLHNATAAQALANYEPRPSFPLSLRPVVTPASNPDQFKANQAAIRDAQLARLSGRPPQPAKANIMLPGTGFPGPNVYVRTWMALKSEILEEQEYALHHLVKISLERGDKYRFDQFGGLMEALVAKLLEASSFFYLTPWITSFDEEVQKLGNVLDALNGTPDILDRMRRSKRRQARDKIETADLTRKLRLINEAGLVIRNLVMLDENALYALKYPPTRDTLTILLNLPDDPAIIETKHYALEIVEQLARFMQPAEDDALISTVMGLISSSDRGVILTALRIISRTGTRLDFLTPLPTCPTHVINRLSEWLTVEDQELRTAILDVFYRYTANVENVDLLLRTYDLESLVRQLTRFLQYGARHEETQQVLTTRHEETQQVLTTRQTQQVPQETSSNPPSASDVQPIPKISQDHAELLLSYDEPERSSQWLRACFYEDTTGEITQIALWQAYQIPFTPYSTSRPLLPAKDFITNVSTTFSRATAQVIQGDTPKFIIRGIRPREVPVDPKGMSFMRCHWILEADDAASNAKAGEECREFAMAPMKMWEHVVSAHLGVPKNDDGKLDPAALPPDKKVSCRWAGCSRSSKQQDEHHNTPFAVGMHVKTHLPDTSPMQYQRNKHNMGGENKDGKQQPQPLTTRTWSTNTTLQDDKMEATGLPLTTCLVLRNLARNIPKTPFAQERREKMGSTVQALFAPVMSQLYHVLAYNRALSEYLSVLMRLVEGDG